MDFERMPPHDEDGITSAFSGGFSMYRSIWTEMLTNGVARMPAPLPPFAWRELYQTFDEFVDWAKLHRMQSAALDTEAAAWRAESGLRSMYASYFSPYYRDRVGQQGKDRKQILQLCEPFYRHLSRRKDSWLSVPAFRLLADRMMVALYTSFSACVPLVHALADFDQRLASALMPRHQSPPVALRLLRYEADQHLCTAPHVDKSALTIILNTDDPKGDDCLVFGPVAPGAAPVLLSQFSPIAKAEEESVAFVGAAPMQAGFATFRPAWHAVREPRQARVRHSCIFFWLLPNFDMDAFDTAVPFVDDLGAIRPRDVA